MSKLVFIAAGEVSGDMHGAALAQALWEADPSLTIVGTGGLKMKAAGVKLIADFTRMSTIGLLEPLKYIHKYIGIGLIIKQWLKMHRPSIFIPIDNQGFNFFLLKTTQKLGIPSYYYFAPQEWQWGTPEGGRKVAQMVDHILAVFEPEAQFYQAIGANVTFIGHPLLDTTTPTQSKEEFCTTHQLDPTRPILALFPGSRNQELTLTAPILFETAKALQIQHPQLQWVTSIAAPHCEKQIQALIASHHFSQMTLVHESVNLINACTTSLVTSGTITLEHAILQKPCVVAYKFAPLSYFVLTKFFAKKVNRIKFMALPNLIADQLVLPEFLQKKATVSALSQALTKFLDPTSHDYTQTQSQLAKIKAKLGNPGVLTHAATVILSTQSRPLSPKSDIL